MLAAAACSSDALAASPAPLSLVPDKSCYKIGDTVTVSINVGDACSTTLGCTATFPNADIAGDGGPVMLQDFTFIQINFLQFRDPDCCNNAVLAAPNTPGGPTTDISVWELAAQGKPELALADLNRDGRLNFADVVHAMQHGVTSCVADCNDDGVVSAQDIFDLLRGWFAHHPAADINHDGVTSIEDIFDFLAAWFTPCS